jgi:uncharacterized membrane protein YeiH
MMKRVVSRISAGSKASRTRPATVDANRRLRPLIGAVPPAAIAHWRYFAITIAAGLVGFFASAQIARLKTPVQLFDAAGLCLFAVTGTEKALAYGLNPFVAAVLGMMTCIGGGVARDLLTLEIPTVLRAELYAVAALAGAGSMALGFTLGLPHIPVMVFGAGLCLFLRLMSLYRGWRLPSSKYFKETD